MTVEQLASGVPPGAADAVEPAGEAHHDPRPYGLRRNGSPAQDGSYLERLLAEQRRRDPSSTEEEALNRALAIFEEQRKIDPSLKKELVRLRPTSGSESATQHPVVQAAAIMRLGPVADLHDAFMTRGRHGPVSRYRSGASAALVMGAFGLCRQDIKGCWTRLQQEPIAAWAFARAAEDSGGLAYPYVDCDWGSNSGMYDAVAALTRKLSPEMLLVCNVELIKQMAALVDANGRPVHPDIGRRLIADGSAIEAHAPQSAPVSERDLLIRQRGRDRGARFQYFNSGKSWFGYRQIVLTDLASTLPLIWMVVPAIADERIVTWRLLGLLFQLWPECPVEILLGDALYGHSKDFLLALEGYHGIHPCFRLRKVAEGTPWIKTEGVPHCAHGEMKRNHCDFVDAVARRRRGGPARGELPINWNPRLRWDCPIQDPNCKEVATRPRDEPRLYTYLPHTGKDRWAVTRAALSVHRNGVEATFAAQQAKGVAGKSSARLRTANEGTLEMMIGLSHLRQTASRVATATGAYELAEDEAKSLGFNLAINENRPAHGPSAAQLRDVTREFAGQWSSISTRAGIRPIDRADDQLEISRYMELPKGQLMPEGQHTYGTMPKLPD